MLRDPRKEVSGVYCNTLSTSCVVATVEIVHSENNQQTVTKKRCES